MQNVLLALMVAAAFAFGWFQMGKLDRFLDADRRAQESRSASGENALRLGFYSPTAADSIADILEQYSKLYPDIPSRVFCGLEEELLKGLYTGRFDTIFLPENVERAK